MKKQIAFILLCYSIFVFTNCNSNNSQNEENQITVAASSSLSKAFDELAKAFTAKTKINLTTSYDATANLQKQIENGAPFDVFASADAEAIVKLRKNGFTIRESEKIFARGSLVLWSPSLQIKNLEELTNPNITRIAIANPEIAPYGRAAIEALKKKNLYEQVKDKLIFGQNVTQVKQYAETGNVDVAFIPLSLAKDVKGTVIEIDASLYEPLDNSIAVIKESKAQTSAQRFVDFVMSEEGQAILRKYGYK